MKELRCVCSRINQTGQTVHNKVAEFNDNYVVIKCDIAGCKKFNVIGIVNGKLQQIKVGISHSEMLKTVSN